jgi:hypothetical protein
LAHRLERCEIVEGPGDCIACVQTIGEIEDGACGCRNRAMLEDTMVDTSARESARNETAHASNAGKNPAS